MAGNVKEVDTPHMGNGRDVQMGITTVEWKLSARPGSTPDGQTSGLGLCRVQRSAFIGGLNGVATLDCKQSDRHA